MSSAVVWIASLFHINGVRHGFGYSIRIEGLSRYLLPNSPIVMRFADDDLSGLSSIKSEMQRVCHWPCTDDFAVIFFVLREFVTEENCEGGWPGVFRDHGAPAIMLCEWQIGPQLEDLHRYDFIMLIDTTAVTYPEIE